MLLDIGQPSASDRPLGHDRPVDEILEAAPADSATQHIAERAPEPGHRAAPTRSSRWRVTTSTLHDASIPPIVNEPIGPSCSSTISSTQWPLPRMSANAPFSSRRAASAFSHRAQNAAASPARCWLGAPPIRRVHGRDTPGRPMLATTPVISRPTAEHRPSRSHAEATRGERHALMGVRRCSTAGSDQPRTRPLRRIRVGLAGLGSVIMPRRPNIVFILTDDHAAHSIGCYGSVVNAHATRLDEIAAQRVAGSTTASSRTRSARRLGHRS